MRISNLLKQKTVNKVIDPGAVDLQGVFNPFTVGNLEFPDVENEGIPPVLKDVQELAKKAKNEIKSTIEYINVSFKSDAFQDYSKLVQYNYLPLEQILDQGISYPYYTAPVTVIEKVEKEIHKSEKRSEPFLHTLYLHLQRSEVLSYVYDDLVEKLFKPKPPSSTGVPLIDVANAAKYNENLTKIEDNTALKYLLYKGRTELDSLIEYAIGLRSDIDNPFEDDIKRFTSYLINRGFEGYRGDVLKGFLSQYESTGESIWKSHKRVVESSYGNPLDNVLKEIVTFQLASLVSNVNTEIDELINIVEEYAFDAQIPSFNYIGKVLKDSVIDASIDFRKMCGYREGSFEAEEESRQVSLQARTMLQISNALTLGSKNAENLIKQLATETLKKMEFPRS